MRIFLGLSIINLRSWWNWQTHHLEGVAGRPVRVRVSPTALCSEAGEILQSGPLVKRFNTAAFHAVIQGFESPTGHHFFGIRVLD
jgi:hypothetical protein